MDTVYPAGASALARGRRLRRGPQRARTRTQPVTFAEIKEVDEEAEEADEGRSQPRAGASGSGGVDERRRRDELVASTSWAEWGEPLEAREAPAPLARQFFESRRRRARRDVIPSVSAMYYTRPGPSVASRSRRAGMSYRQYPLCTTHVLGRVGRAARGARGPSAARPPVLREPPQEGAPGCHTVSIHYVLHTSWAEWGEPLEARRDVIPSVSTMYYTRPGPSGASRSRRARPQRRSPASSSRAAAAGRAGMSYRQYPLCTTRPGPSGASRSRRARPPRRSPASSSRAAAGGRAGMSYRQYPLCTTHVLGRVGGAARGARGRSAARPPVLRAAAGGRAGMSYRQYPLCTHTSWAEWGAARGARGRSAARPPVLREPPQEGAPGCHTVSIHYVLHTSWAEWGEPLEAREAPAPLARQFFESRRRRARRDVIPSVSTMYYTRPGPSGASRLRRARPPRRSPASSSSRRRRARRDVIPSVSTMYYTRPGPSGASRSRRARPQRRSPASSSSRRRRARRDVIPSVSTMYYTRPGPSGASRSRRARTPRRSPASSSRAAAGGRAGMSYRQYPLFRTHVLGRVGGAARGARGRSTARPPVLREPPQEGAPGCHTVSIHYVLHTSWAEWGEPLEAREAPAPLARQFFESRRRRARRDVIPSVSTMYYTRPGPSGASRSRRARPQRRSPASSSRAAAAGRAGMSYRQYPLCTTHVLGRVGRAARGARGPSAARSPVLREPPQEGAPGCYTVMSLRKRALVCRARRASPASTPRPDLTSLPDEEFDATRKNYGTIGQEME
ncbi:hypothetical protein NE865_15290 [Phthorimaea operculella]|nr:hypothetical protein NE865_15290 [Phthorimaea operculella]